MVGCGNREGSVFLNLARGNELRPRNGAKTNLPFGKRANGKDDHLAAYWIKLRLTAADGCECRRQTEDSKVGRDGALFEHAKPWKNAVMNHRPASSTVSPSSRLQMRCQTPSGAVAVGVLFDWML